MILSKCTNMHLASAFVAGDNTVERILAPMSFAVRLIVDPEQIMAIGTLAECYNNINVFRGVVKIRRGGFHFSWFYANEHFTKDVHKLPVFAKDLACLVN